MTAEMQSIWHGVIDMVEVEKTEKKPFNGVRSFHLSEEVDGKLLELVKRCTATGQGKNRSAVVALAITSLYDKLIG